MAGTRCGGDVLRVIEQGSPGGIRRAIGQWLRVSAALVNAAASCAEQAYPLHALAAAWEGTKVTRVAPVAAEGGQDIVLSSVLRAGSGLGQPQDSPEVVLRQS